MTEELELLGNLARKAGAAILEVYAGVFTVEEKDDHSPLTLADKRSHEIISAGLREHFPDIPVLSEEGKEVPYADRRGWTRFWLVDPLDGTKEFVKRNGEFTVNIALVEGDQPTLGVIYLPVADLLYLADIRRGCWEIAEGTSRALRMHDPDPERPVRVVTSRSHPVPQLQDLLQRLPSHETLPRGSCG